MLMNLTECIIPQQMLDQDCFEYLPRVLLEYQRYLKENDAVDFEDMINESARVLRQVKEMRQKLHFKYIIVDEYQDISRPSVLI